MKSENEKLRKLSKYFGVNQSSQSSFSSATITIESLNTLGEHIEEKDLIKVKQLYKELDTNNSNSVTLESFLKEIIKRDLINFPIRTIDKNKNSIKKVSRQFTTKCERIIRLLKEMKLVAIEEKDTGSISNIEAIISTLNEANIYEMDSTLLNKNDQLSEEYKNGVGFLVQYSKMEQINAKTKDFSALRNTIRYRTISSEGNLEIQKKKDVDSEAKGRRMTLNVSSVISPSISAKIASLMSRLPYNDFDIFALDNLITNKASVYVAKEILSTIKIISEDGLVNEVMLNLFIEKVAESYDRKAAIYHNDLHAGDVMQTLYTMFYHGFLEEKMQLRELDKFAILIGALCHDLRHTGQNNIFHINSRSKIALRYNDISVLENFHVAQTFKLLNNPQYDLFSHFKPEEYRTLRRRIIEGILSTDMANHQKVISAIKAKIDLFSIEKGTNFEKIFNVETDKLFDAQQSVLNMALHSADISNPAKPSKISDTWTKMVYDEFFLQGDLEKKLSLPVSLLCDRETTNINKAMIGFINFVVGPTFDILINIIPEVSDYSNYIKANLKKYENAIEKAKV